MLIEEIPELDVQKLLDRDPYLSDHKDEITKRFGGKWCRTDSVRHSMLKSTQSASFWLRSSSNQSGISQHSVSTQRALSEHSESTQREIREHSESNQSINIRVNTVGV